MCYYYGGRSTFAQELDLHEKLEQLGVYQFGHPYGHLGFRIPNDAHGDIVIRLMQRAGGAEQGIVALNTCAHCQAERVSLPITTLIQIVAFATGIDSPCGCHTPATQTSPVLYEPVSPDLEW